MFYTKSRLPGGERVKTEITDGNVFTKCAICGRELPVDLAEVLSDGEGDLFSTSILCARCSQGSMKARDSVPEAKIALLTQEGLVWLAHPLTRFGYADEIQELCALYMVDRPEDLSAMDCTGFGSALVRRVLGALED